MKHFAFLDVDSTLIFGNHPNQTINHALLDSLLEQGITDVYLFTNMSMNEIIRFQPRDPENPEEVSSRYDLIEAMRKKGFQIHDVITPADTGYYHEDGVLHPIGTAYRELYDPLMHQLVRMQSSLDLNQYTSDLDLTLTFFRNLYQFEKALYLETQSRLIPNGELRAIPSFGYCLIHRQTGEQTFVDDHGLETILKNEGEKANYEIVVRPNPQLQIMVKGNSAGIPEGHDPSQRYDNMKAVMLQRAFPELYKTYGPIAITYFDDTTVHLDSTKAVIANAEEAGLISFSTCQINRDFQVAMSEPEKTKYKTAMVQTNLKAQDRQEAINTNLTNVLNSGVRWPGTRAKAAQYLRENIAYANPNQLIQIANIAIQGNERLFPVASKANALKCLMIAYLKASSPEEINFVKSNIDAFLIQHGYVDLNEAGYPFVNNLLKALKDYASSNASYSSLAKDLVNRMISLQTSLLTGIPIEEETLRTNESTALLYWRAVLNQANEPNFYHTNALTQPEPSPASSSSTMSPQTPVILPSLAGHPQTTNRKFAFLDVDCTLLFEQRSLNLRYLHTLLDTGITDVYLFTNMDMEDIRIFGYDSAPMSRHELIQQMEAMGFKVHGVVTPADNGYFEDDGQPKPIGAAYRELIQPLMQSYVAAGDGLQSYKASKDHQLAYWRATLKWSQARDIGSAMKKLHHGEIQSFEQKSLALIHNKTREITYINEDELIQFLDDQDRHAQYSITIEINPNKKFSVIGNRAGTGHQVGSLSRSEDTPYEKDNTKGIMMQKAAGELVSQYGPISIVFGDDLKKNLDSARIAMQAYVETGLVCLETCLVSQQYDVALSTQAGLQYQYSIETMIQTMASAQDKLAQGIRTLFDMSLPSQVKQPVALSIRENLAHATPAQLVKLSKLATQGHNVLFEDPSLKTAFKCLQIAYLKASSLEEQQETQKQISVFLHSHDYAIFSRMKTQDLQVADLLTSLTGISRHELTSSLIARQLLERHIVIKTQILEVLSPGTEDYQNEQLALQSYQAMLTGELYLPAQAASSSPMPNVPNPAVVNGTLFHSTSAPGAQSMGSENVISP
jgi:hypothetical protein